MDLWCWEFKSYRGACMFSLCFWGLGSFFRERPPGGKTRFSYAACQLFCLSKVPDSCCSIRCSNQRGDKPELCFYRIPSEKENPERRRLWICVIRHASFPGEGQEWQPSKYTRVCSEHFIKGAKSDDPLSPDWVPSVFLHTKATKRRKREKDMERYEQHSRIQNKSMDQRKQQDAVDVLLKLSSVPVAEDEQQCDNKPCKENSARLAKEFNDLQEENHRLRDIIKSGTFDELFFEKDDETVKAVTGIPTYSKF
ncbi:LOW QUALITY PROTEIN: THAP domain-containing protein 1-like [Ictalurus punctatus]|uniref:LOW QUALITY PROTEIN: THAP domain-containing protein 1-like n=1 Tax=Ictalurus punctatus TaxID=7998 RepID=A0A9F7RR05_ICTPU|nr:LOW QUALITY PROTEIN: THAP domain-containing protein 1-like [Ictalurus punctatus]